VADRALPRRGLCVDSADMPPVEQALLRAAQALAASQNALLASVTAQCQLQSRIGVLLSEIEHAGVAVDVARLDSVRARAAQLAHTCTQRALELACVANLDSLRAAVLPNGDRLSLSALDSCAHPAAVWWARSRRLDGLVRHADALRASVRASVVHCRFDLLHHENGRISSLEPNLQCLPKALIVIVPDGSGSTDDEQFALRSCIVARPGHLLASADFRQMELRIVAALSGERRLLADGDAFVAVAALCGDGVNRDQAKEVFYANLYGAGAARIAASLSCSKERAESIRRALDDAFPTLRAWRDQVFCDCRAAGNVVVSPIYGARRHIPDLSAADEFTRLAAERRAINALVQGVASDVFKTVMLNVHLAVFPHLARIVMPLHDELLLEVAADRVAELERVLRKEMCVQICESDPTLQIAIRSGASWGSLSERKTDN
jgi:DNA polymerase I-like protein with 3'-5' exonuclease and polymerase domains